MSQRLRTRMPDREARVHSRKRYITRPDAPGSDPQLVLGLIQVESGFRKYAVSLFRSARLHAGDAFLGRIDRPSGHDLFHLRINLRYGCTILRHYLDIEKGDLYRALGRYNGSLGQPEYPNLVRAAWEHNWNWPPSAKHP